MRPCGQSCAVAGSAAGCVVPVLGSPSPRLPLPVHLLPWGRPLSPGLLSAHRAGPCTPSAPLCIRRDWGPPGIGLMGLPTLWVWRDSPGPCPGLQRGVGPGCHSHGAPSFLGAGNTSAPPASLKKTSARVTDVLFRLRWRVWAGLLRAGTLSWAHVSLPACVPVCGQWGSTWGSAALPAPALPGPWPLPLTSCSADLQSEAAAARLDSEQGGPKGASCPGFWKCLSPPSPGGCSLLSVHPGWPLTSPGSPAGPQSCLLLARDAHRARPWADGATPPRPPI